MTYSVENLSKILGLYFHQDWNLEFDSDMAAIRAIIESEHVENISKSSIEIRKLISSDLSEKELMELMTVKAGCFFNPSSKGRTYREWLAEILSQIDPI